MTEKIFLLGFMGAGKSYWGRQLAERLQLPLYDLDEQIVEAEGRTVAEIFTEKGEVYFRERERDFLHRLAEKPAFLLSCGGGTPCYFDNMAFMNQTGLTVWLNSSVSVMVERLLRKKYKRPLIAGLSDEALTVYVTQKLAERRPFYEQAKLILNTDALTADHFVEKIIHA